MTRVEGAHGSFEAPAGWAVLDGGVAAEGALVEGAVRRSIVVNGDRPIEGKTPAEYVALQQAMLPEVLANYAVLEARALSEPDGGPWLLHHRFALPGEPALLQWQVYFFEADRVGILTATAAADGAGDLQAQVFRAMGTFAFPARASAEDGELRDHAHDGEEHQHQRGDHQ